MPPIEQEAHALLRFLERLGGALEIALHGGRESDLPLDLFKLGHRIAERHALRQIERQRHGGKLAEVIDRSEAACRGVIFATAESGTDEPTLAAGDGRGARGREIEPVQAHRRPAGIAGSSSRIDPILVGLGVDRCDTAARRKPRPARFRSAAS